MPTSRMLQTKEELFNYVQEAVFTISSSQSAVATTQAVMKFLTDKYGPQEEKQVWQTLKKMSRTDGPLDHVKGRGANSSYKLRVKFNPRLSSSPKKNIISKKTSPLKCSAKKYSNHVKPDPKKRGQTNGQEIKDTGSNFDEVDGHWPIIDPGLRDETDGPSCNKTVVDTRFLRE